VANQIGGGALTLCDAATLGAWFGISSTDLLTVLPNLVNWSVSQRNLGFI
jgi:hypothetical protein